VSTANPDSEIDDLIVNNTPVKQLSNEMDALRNAVGSAMGGNKQQNPGNQQGHGNQQGFGNQQDFSNQQGSMNRPTEEKQGGGGFLGGLGDKFNSAAGGGRESEKNEDYLDKGMSLMLLERTLPHRDPSPSSAAVGDGILLGYPAYTSQFDVYS